MNIQVQTCGLIVITLLMIFYKSQKTLKLYQERLFQIVLITALATLATDVLSIVAIHYRAHLNIHFVNAVCKAYLISMLLSSFCALFYVLVGIVPEKKRLTSFYVGSALLTAEMLAIVLSPISIYENGREVYTADIAVILTYVFTIAFILMTLFVAIFLLRKVNKRRAGAVILWMSCWIVAAVIQFFHNELLLVGFAGSLGMVILYVSLETPEANQDKQFGCFNSYAFDVYFRDAAAYDRKCSLLEINLLDKQLLSEHDFHPIKTPRKLIERIQQHRGVKVFKNLDYSIFVVSEKREKLDEVYADFRKMIEPYDIGSRIVCTMTDDCRIFSGSVELSQVLAFSHNHPADLKTGLIMISQATVNHFHEEEKTVLEIKSALKEDRVIVYLQPIYSFVSGRFETAEALVRIRGKDGGMISPGVFIPVAEKSGLIVELGERIFEKVCEFLAQNDPETLGIKYIEVNLSVVQCEREELAEQLLKTMERYHIAPELINFEITETGSLTAKGQMLDNMDKLQKEGATFSLDDFGKGESNLSYLIDMPISAVKMDYEMTKSFGVNDRAKHVVHSVVDLAHNMGLKVVAEGIETEEELSTFRKNNVDFIQGFYFSRPIPMDEYLAFVKKNNVVNE